MRRIDILTPAAAGETKGNVVHVVATVAANLAKLFPVHEEFSSKNICLSFLRGQVPTSDEHSSRIKRVTKHYTSLSGDVLRGRVMI